MSALSPHDPERTAVYGPPSTGSPVARMANALATEVDVSGGEGPRGQVVHADLHAIATRLGTSAAQHQDRVTPDPPCPGV